MVGALLHLRFWSLRNWAVASAKRLRQPKYLFSALFGAAYLYWLIFRHVRSLVVAGAPARGIGMGARLLDPVLPPEAVTVAAALVLFVVILVQFSFAWISPAPNPRLKFTEPEIAFLFPAPISRLRLIHFNLLSSQFNILVSSFLLTVVFDRWSFLGGHALARAVGWWLILSTISLLNTFSQLTVARRIERAGPGVRLRVLAAIALLVGALVYSSWQRARPPADHELRSLPAMATYVSGWLDSGLAHTVLTPFKWVTGPFAAVSLRSFLLALGPALLVPGVLYLAITRLEISFAEGSIAHAEHREQVRAAMRSGNFRARGRTFKLKAIRAPFHLHDRGRPEIAFFWKNLIAIQSWFNLRVFVVILSAPAVILAAKLADPRNHVGNAALMVITVAAAVAGYTLLAGPQLIRQDLRSDLGNADILKTYPLAGWQVVLGEIFTPALVLSGILWLALLAAAWAGTDMPSKTGPFRPATEATLVVCAGIAIPLVVLLQLLIPNGAALLFPAWHQATRSRTAGPEAIGQRLIFVFGQLLAVVLALVPAGMLGVGLYLATSYYATWVTSRASLVRAAALAMGTAGIVAVIAGELCVAIWWLGRRFERLDIALELRQ